MLSSVSCLTWSFRFCNIAYLSASFRLQARSFCALIKTRKKIEEEQMAKSLRNALHKCNGTSSRVLNPDDPVQILVEIVSAQDLLRADLQLANPYVVVRMGETEVHRAKHVKKT